MAINPDMVKVPSIHEIMEEWDTESAFNKRRVPDELARTGSMHSKYTRYMALHNILAAKTLTEYTRVRAIKWDYFSGDLNNPESIKEFGLPGPFMNVINSKEAKERKLDSDPELTNLLLKKAMHEQAAEMCKNIIKELNNRTWQGRIIVDWDRFYGGSDGSFVSSGGRMKNENDDSES